MEAISCLDCKKPTATVLDHRSGDTICTECGLVLESHHIDDSSEWRIFADDPSDHDPTRVGAPSNPLLTRGNLTTVLRSTNPNDKAAKELISAAFRTQSLEKHHPDEILNKGFDLISTMTEKLGLSELIKNRACEIFSKLGEKKGFRGKKFTCVCAACVFMSCRELRLSRTLKEISVVAEGAQLKEINKACIAIKGLVEIEAVATVNTGELVRRFCSNLAMSQRETKAVQEAVQRAEVFDIRRSPKSVLAAIIYMISHLSEDEKKPLREISLAAEVAEVTIKKSLRDIYPYASRLVPEWYASEEDIHKLIRSYVLSS